jgi:hypothetical protein
MAERRTWAAGRRRKPNLECDHLLELGWSEDAAQGADGGDQFLRVAPTLRSVVGEHEGGTERLRLGWCGPACVGRRWRRRLRRRAHREQRIGEIAPRIDLMRPDADFRFQRSQVTRKG